MTRVAIIGATGLIGRQLVPQLLARGFDLLVLTRRPTGISGVDERIAPMDQWPDLLRKERVDIAISTLGSTRAKAGSWDAFVAIDEIAVLDFATAAKAAGARQFLFVSAVGADPNSKAPYLALKGRVEHALAELDFDRLDLIQPGLLLGERGADRRVGERLAIWLSPLTDLLMRGRLARYRSIDAGIVAAAMARLCGAKDADLFSYENKGLIRLIA